jgi:hypothetical protein
MSVAGLAQRHSDGLRAGRVGRPGLDSRQRQEIFLFLVSRPALGPTQPPIQRVSGAFSPEVKRPGCEADHSPFIYRRGQELWSHTSTPTCLHGVVIN